MRTSNDGREQDQMEFASAFSTLTGRSRSGAHVASSLLVVVAVALRLVAILLCCLVVADALFAGEFRVALLGLNGTLTSLIPAPLSGSCVFQTPFGGVFRGDFAIAAIMLFVIDWLISRASTSLR